MYPSPFSTVPALTLDFGSFGACFADFPVDFEGVDWEIASRYSGSRAGEGLRGVENG